RSRPAGCLHAARPRSLRSKRSDPSNAPPSLGRVQRELRRASQQPATALKYHPRVMYLFWQILIGILAGYLAGRIMRGRGYGLVIDLLLGIVGSILGGFVFGLLGIYPAGIIGRLLVATAGAVLPISHPPRGARSASSPAP